MSDSKTNKLKARLPRGLADRGAAEIAATRRMLETIRQVFERYGFEPVETPQIEYTDALGKFLPDQDRPNEGVFSFQDDDEQWLSLRYDLTAPLARYVAENFQHLTLPYRSYRSGWVFRNEKPGPGRFRQFMQFDADTVGSASMAADAEVCMMIADTMEELGIPRGLYVVKVNNRKLLDGVMDSIGLGDDWNQQRRLAVLRALDKYDRLGEAGVRDLLGPGRRDESGDYSTGVGLEDFHIHELLTLFRLNPQGVSTFDALPEWERYDSNFVSVDLDRHSGRLVRQIHPEYGPDRVPINNMDTIEYLAGALGYHPKIEEALRELRQIAEIARASGYGSKRIMIDPSVVRGLEYYTGPVYEVELLIETSDEKGRPIRFGSVGGGGRYDGLVSRFRGQPVPATGFSIGVSRLRAALTSIDRLSARPSYGPVLVTVFGGDIAHYQRLVSMLRHAGIRTELYLGNPKHSLGQQLKYADKRRSPLALIQGSEERERGVVQIKNLMSGTDRANTSDRNEYLRAQSQSQMAVSEDSVVEAVLSILADYEIRWD